MDKTCGDCPNCGWYDDMWSHWCVKAPGNGKIKIDDPICAERKQDLEKAEQESEFLMCKDCPHILTDPVTEKYSCYVGGFKTEVSLTSKICEARIMERLDKKYIRHMTKNGILITSELMPFERALAYAKVGSDIGRKGTQVYMRIGRTDKDTIGFVESSIFEPITISHEDILADDWILG